MPTSTLEELTRLGISGGALARNPRARLGAARSIQRQLDFILRSDEPVPTEANARTPSGRIINEYHREIGRLRRDFINTNVANLFPNQNVTSRTVAGQQFGPGAAPTAEQLDVIERNFRTPLQVLDDTIAARIDPDIGAQGKALILARQVAAQDPGLALLPGPLIGGGVTRRQVPQGKPTPEAGQGAPLARERRRFTIGKRAQTILTSDADRPVGGKTILG